MRTHRFEIQKVANGFIVQAGCQTFISHSIGEVFAEIKRYYDNPRKVEKEYREKYKIPNDGDMPTTPEAVRNY